VSAETELAATGVRLEYVAGSHVAPGTPNPQRTGVISNMAMKKAKTKKMTKKAAPKKK
jgi:hypothetical protein